MDHAKYLVEALLLSMIVGFVLLSTGCREIQAAGGVAVSSSSTEAIRSNPFNDVSKRLKRSYSRLPPPRMAVPIHYRFRVPPSFKAPPPPEEVTPPAPPPAVVATPVPPPPEEVTPPAPPPAVVATPVPPPAAVAAQAPPPSTPSAEPLFAPPPPPQPPVY